MIPQCPIGAILRGIDYFQIGNKSVAFRIESGVCQLQVFPNFCLFINSTDINLVVEIDIDHRESGVKHKSDITLGLDLIDGEVFFGV